jgi:hypothetical protein
MPQSLSLATPRRAERPLHKFLLNILTKLQTKDMGRDHAYPILTIGTIIPDPNKCQEFF